MEIQCVKFTPNLNSIDKEFEFLFNVSWPETSKIIEISGGYIEVNGKKIGDLAEFNRANTTALYVSALGIESSSKQQYYYTATMRVSDKVIDFLESERHKDHSKSLVFKICLNTTDKMMNIRIAKLYLAGGPNTFSIGQQYIYDRKNEKSKSFILSGNDSELLFINRLDRTTNLEIAVDMMRWIKEFVPYLNAYNILVYEFIELQTLSGSTKIAERYAKAQTSLDEMKKQLSYGEWKQVIIAARPIVELFKNFSDFKDISGYSEPAYIELNASIKHFFEFISKFQHGLNKSNTEVNSNMDVHREDAQMIYCFCVGLLHLVSQKTKRLG
ncbi:MAG: hypothetical protein ACJ77K_17650 [Bacteroidia bacterium]